MGETDTRKKMGNTEFVSERSEGTAHLSTAAGYYGQGVGNGREEASKN